MSNISKRKREGSRPKIKTMGDHTEFLKRITKTLYYGQLPTLPCLSLPVTEISCELWSEAQRGRSLRRLHADAAAGIARSACVSPCALVLAILYLERLNACNPDYIASTAPADLFLISLMVSNKFLQDDGEDDDVISSEWAASGGLDLAQLNKLELDFLDAIDWNIYVSEESFEGGLRRLERQVALRQAQARGFFTYGDLAAASDAALLTELGAACLALGYLLTMLTSALVVAMLPTLHAPSAAPATTYVHNTTVDMNTVALDRLAPVTVHCCSEWRQRIDAELPAKYWYDNVAVLELKSSDTWWGQASALGWLYHSSLDPLQRWLGRLTEYKAPPPRVCRQRLNLSKLAGFAAAVSDR